MLKYLNKEIKLINKVDSLNIINLEDKIDYLSKSEGYLIKGVILINGDYFSSGVIHEFKDKLDINFLINYQNILTKEEVSLKLEDFDVSINQNVLYFSFKFNLNGYYENKECFLSKEEKTPLLEYKKYPLLTHNLLVKEEAKENVIMLPFTSKEKENDFDLSLELKITKPIEINKCEEEGEDVRFNIQGKEKSFFNELFKSDKSSLTSKYHVVLDDEDYETIARELNVSLTKLKQINQNKKLTKGLIIKLPL